jgi:hypothetical protein
MGPPVPDTPDPQSSLDSSAPHQPRPAGGGEIRGRSVRVVAGVYRYTVRPLLVALGAGGGTCRFHPSCSAYAEEAIRSHGWWRGGGLALGRVLRCRPGGRCGWDPVPAPRERTLSSRTTPLSEEP